MSMPELRGYWANVRAGIMKMQGLGEHGNKRLMEIRYESNYCTAWRAKL